MRGVKARRRLCSLPDIRSRASSAAAKATSKSSSRRFNARLVKAWADATIREAVFFATEQAGRACESANEPRIPLVSFPGQFFEASDLTGVQIAARYSGTRPTL